MILIVNRIVILYENHASDLPLPPKKKKKNLPDSVDSVHFRHRGRIPHSNQFDSFLAVGEELEKVWQS